MNSLEITSLLKWFYWDTRENPRIVELCRKYPNLMNNPCISKHLHERYPRVLLQPGEKSELQKQLTNPEPWLLSSIRQERYSKPIVFQFRTPFGRTTE